MALDRPDWWLPTYPSKVIYGEGQSAWYFVQTVAITGESYTDMGMYPVPEGYQLHIAGITMSTDYPIIQQCSFIYAGEVIGQFWYNLSFSHPFNSVATHLLQYPQTFKLRAHNLDTAEHNFTLLAIGYEEKITTS